MDWNYWEQCGVHRKSLHFIQQQYSMDEIKKGLCIAVVAKILLFVISSAYLDTSILTSESTAIHATLKIRKLYSEKQLKQMAYYNNYLGETNMVLASVEKMDLKKLGLQENKIIINKRTLLSDAEENDVLNKFYKKEDIDKNVQIKYTLQEHDKNQSLYLNIKNNKEEKLKWTQILTRQVDILK